MSANNKKNNNSNKDVKKLHDLTLTRPWRAARSPKSSVRKGRCYCLHVRNKGLKLVLKRLIYEMKATCLHGYFPRHSSLTRGCGQRGANQMKLSVNVSNRIETREGELRAESEATWPQENTSERLFGDISKYSQYASKEILFVHEVQLAHVRYP